MASSGNPLAPIRAKQLRVLMPPSLQKLRICDELARSFDAAAGGGGGEEDGAAHKATALVVSPFGKVWRVEVGRDGDGAFLGRGWPEFLAAHGVSVGWFVVLRHEGGGTITVKAFDTSFCIKEFGAPATAMVSSRGSKEVSCKPQFIRVIHQNSVEKMIIPAKFVKHYLTEEHLDTARMAVLLSPLGKFWRIQLEKGGSGMFFAGGWSQFLAFHDISEGDIVLLRYEGNMAFRFKVFGLNGCQKNLKNQETTGTQQITDTVKQSESSSLIRKRKYSDERSSSEKEKNRMKSCMKSSSKTSAQKQPDYQIGPPSWIKKEVTSYMLKRLLSLSVKFCNSIGFKKSCVITLKTAMNSTRSWQVRGLAYNKVRYLTGEGWKRFCKDSKLTKGDICTFNIVEPTLWHAVIAHSTFTDTEEEKELPCSSRRHGETKNKRLVCEGDRRTTKYSSNVLSKSLLTSYTKSLYKIGPPSWIQKQITPNSLNKCLSLSRAFCNQIGLNDSCTITLKTSIKDTRCWQVSGLLSKNGSYHLGSGWKKFYEENKLKVGDVCTFNVIETLLWHVVIRHQ